MKIYCLSGLGADKKAFQYLKIENVELVHIDWIDPLPKESLENYAERLFHQNIHEDEYNLMGLSFGGMLAQEFAKLRPPKNLILISTLTSGKELSNTLKMVGRLRLHRCIPNKLLKSSNWITRYLFGTHEPKVAKLFQQILNESDPAYIRWAIGAILSWRNNQIAKSIRIHGDRDKLLPLKFQVDFTIPGGKHLMIIDRADEISSIIQKGLIK